MAYTALGGQLWQWPRFAELTPSTRLVYLGLLTARPRGCPGLFNYGTAGVADLLQLPSVEVASALAELEGRGLVEYDEECRRVFRFTVWPPGEKGLRAQNGKCVRMWFGAWSEVPDCPAKYRHIESIRELVPPGAKTRDEEWANTFGAIDPTTAQVAQVIRPQPELPFNSRPQHRETGMPGAREDQPVGSTPNRPVADPVPDADPVPVLAEGTRPGVQAPVAARPLPTLRVVRGRGGHESVSERAGADPPEGAGEARRRDERASELPLDGKSEGWIASESESRWAREADRPTVGQVARRSDSRMAGENAVSEGADERAVLGEAEGSGAGPPDGGRGFVVHELVETLEEAAGGRVAATPIDPRLLPQLRETADRLDEAGIGLEEVKLAGAWLRAGGLGYRDDLGCRWIAKPGALTDAIAAARAWDRRGRPAVGRAPPARKGRAEPPPRDVWEDLPFEQPLTP